MTTIEHGSNLLQDNINLDAAIIATTTPVAKLGNWYLEYSPYPVFSNQLNLTLTKESINDRVILDLFEAYKMIKDFFIEELNESSIRMITEVSPTKIEVSFSTFSDGDMDSLIKEEPFTFPANFNNSLPAEYEHIELSKSSLPLMDRKAYLSFVDENEFDGCLFCDNELKPLQRVRMGSKDWYFSETISPYFDLHGMIVSTRHVKCLSELNNREKLSFFNFSTSVIYPSFVSLNSPNLRTIFHYREQGESKRNRLCVHLHVHASSFSEGDLTRLKTEPIEFPRDKFMKWKNNYEQ